LLDGVVSSMKNGEEMEKSGKRLLNSDGGNRCGVGGSDVSVMKERERIADSGVSTTEEGQKLLNSGVSASEESQKF
jgi:hypothetical protein